MATRLLIDAAHPEETRVVVINGTRLDEFDFESSRKKQLKGNIYLAKVTRVEPSLQAAFVDYGGNRHGFLAFADIHPDYYQIPVADRRALIQESAAEEAAHGLAEEAAAETEEDSDDLQSEKIEAPEDPDTEGQQDVKKPESLGGDEVDDLQRSRDVRRYKIQEVIKRRQILLIQVVKEERGTKGAALTTYVSLAGRYCVLMPNTARGGGISRKISNVKDRQRLRDIIDALGVPEGMGLIVRTAGQQKTKADMRRDYDYLLRVWHTVRDETLDATAPSLVHEEANLIKRSIRDLYSNNISDVLVEGEEGYKTAKSIMRMLMPSHAKKVQRYDERIPLFHRYQIEQQLDHIHKQTVQLRSGGYIVLNSTEALVAIDVNSGRSTRERSIETTALKTNLEAAEEISRQLRLRDLAGLIVIDFIDMELSRNNRAVERKLKESLKYDRARIQMGRISAFGLLELSRQRMRTSLLEASTESCANCDGTGVVLSTESSSLHILRAIEDEGIKGQSDLTIKVPTSVATYLLNQKRSAISDLEKRFDLNISVIPDPNLIPPDHSIHPEERIGDDSQEISPKEASVTPIDSQLVKSEEAEIKEEGELESGETKSSKRRRRGKRAGRRRRRKDEPAGDSNLISDSNSTAVAAATEENQEQGSGDIVASNGEASKKPSKGRPRRRTHTKMKPESGKEPEPIKTQAKESPIKQAGQTDTKGKVNNIRSSDDKSQRGQSSKAKKSNTIGKKSTKKRPVETKAQAPRSKKIANEHKPKDQTASSSAGAKKPKEPARKGWWQVGS